MWFRVVSEVFLYEFCQHTESGSFYILKFCSIRVLFLILLVCPHFFYDLSSLIPHLPETFSSITNLLAFVSMIQHSLMPDVLIYMWVKAFLPCPHLKLLGQLNWYGNMSPDWRPRNLASIPIRSKIFFSSPQYPDRFWTPPSLLSDGYQGLCRRG